MAFSLGSVLNPSNLDEDYLNSFEQSTRILMNGGDDGFTSDIDFGGLDGDPGTRSPSDSLFVTDTDSQAHTPYNHLLSIHPQLRHQLSNSQSSVSDSDDVSMTTDLTVGRSQSYGASEVTADDSEADNICYGMVSRSFHDNEQTSG